MFYGLSRLVKNLLPKRLFYRALLIVAIPVILIQLIITIVFFDSLWIKTNKGMTRALVSEIKTFIEVYNNDNYDKDEITKLFSIYQDLNIEFIKDENFNYIYDERWFSPMDRTLRRELKPKINEYCIKVDAVNTTLGYIVNRNIYNKLLSEIPGTGFEIDRYYNQYLFRNKIFKINPEIFYQNFKDSDICNKN